jgi:hypothetical protein
MRRTTAVAAALAALLPTLAQAAEPPCLTRTEFAALAEYALPSIIDGTAQRCRATLGPDAYLPRNGRDLMARYAQRRPAAWPGAKAAFLKLGAATGAEANKLIGTMPDASLQQMLDGLMAGLVSQQVPLDRCATIDRVIGLLSPLPADNTAELIAIGIGLVPKSGHGKVGPITVCEA